TALRYPPIPAGLSARPKMKGLGRRAATRTVVRKAGRLSQRPSAGARQRRPVEEKWALFWMPALGRLLGPEPAPVGEPERRGFPASAGCSFRGLSRGQKSGCRGCSTARAARKSGIAGIVFFEGALASE